MSLTSFNISSSVGPCAMQFVLATISHDIIKQERKNDDSLVSKRKRTVKHLSSTKRENSVLKYVSFDTIAFSKLMNDLTRLLVCDAH